MYIIQTPAIHVLQLICVLPSPTLNIASHVYCALAATLPPIVYVVNDTTNREHRYTMTCRCCMRNAFNHAPAQRNGISRTVVVGTLRTWPSVGDVLWDFSDVVDNWTVDSWGLLTRLTTGLTW